MQQHGTFVLVRGGGKAHMKYIRYRVYDAGGHRVPGLNELKCMIAIILGHQGERKLIWHGSINCDCSNGKAAFEPLADAIPMTPGKTVRTIARP